MKDYDLINTCHESMETYAHTYCLQSKLLRQLYIHVFWPKYKTDPLNRT